jgi:hypothetical protein
VASSNVILENLHDTRNLETTYYVTDMTQASDFYWDRESGLRVNIGILNVHVIPEYEDIDHDGGDNKYMMNNPNNVEDRIKYQNILRQFCRSVINRVLGLCVHWHIRVPEGSPMQEHA